MGAFNWGAFAQYAGKGIKDTGEALRQAEIDKQNQKDKELERERLYMALAEMRHKADLEKQAEDAAAEFGKANTDFQNIGKLDMAAPKLGASGDTAKMTAWSPSEANRKQTFDKLNLAALAPYSPGLLNIQKQVEGEQASLLDAKKTSQEQAFKSSENETQREYEKERDRLDRESREKIAGMSRDAQIMQVAEQRRQAQAAVKNASLDAKDKDALSGAFEAETFLGNLVNTFKEKGYGSAASLPGEIAAKTPLVGKYLAGGHKEYQNQKRKIAELYLRAATGAAAPEHEVSTYMNFLPDESDPIEVAQGKLDNFKNQIMAKAKSRTQIIRTEGDALTQAGQEQFGNQKKMTADVMDKAVMDSLSRIPSLKDTAAADSGKISLARQALNDPDATPKEKARAKEILDKAGVK